MVRKASKAGNQTAIAAVISRSSNSPNRKTFLTVLPPPLSADVTERSPLGPVSFSLGLCPSEKLTFSSPASS